jgi:hypothetical protein
MTPTQTDILLGRIDKVGDDLLADMGRRFEDVKEDFRGVNKRLDVVDSRIGTVETTQAIAKALVVAAKEVADARSDDVGRHVLTYRFKVGIAIAALGGAGVLAQAVLPIVAQVLARR